MKSLVSTCAATSYAIPAYVAVVWLVLLITAVVARALFTCSKTKRSATALEVLRILLRTLISVCVLLYWLHR